MEYDWFLIFNKTEFLALGLVSKEYILNLETLGQKSVMAFAGNYTSIQYDGVFLPINLNSSNPFIFEGYAVFLAANNNVYLGIPV